MTTHKKTIDSVVDAISQVVLGKPLEIKLALTCILARGHLLIEDLPGMGKTTLAHTLAITLGLQFNRVQFTNDLMPADVLGVTVYDRNTAQFSFHPGPAFTQILLADEINRATPKTQSALLEVMEEGQISLDGETRVLPKPFFVIATQNPFHHAGTYPLPESQLDRFLMRISLGYPDAASERNLLKNAGGRSMLNSIESIINAHDLMELQQAASEIHVSDDLLDYLQSLLKASRNITQYPLGLSPRAGICLKQAAQAWALLQGREFVIPEDIQAVFVSVVEHRLHTINTQSMSQNGLALTLLASVAIP